MRKLGLMFGLVAVIASGGCDDPASAQEGAGGTTPPEDSYEVPCDEAHTTITENYDVTLADNEYVRGELKTTVTTTSRYSWTTVENPRDAVVYSCDYVSQTTPAPAPLPAGSYGAASTEVLRDDLRPQGDCFINHGAEVDGDRILSRCTTVVETIFNKSWSEYDPAEHVDRTSESGNRRILITGTPVVE